jgi:hypothetical protein
MATAKKRTSKKTTPTTTPQSTPKEVDTKQLIETELRRHYRSDTSGFIARFFRLADEAIKLKCFKSVDDVRTHVES